MSRVMIFLINIYQKLPISSHKNCKFIPTCSNYSKEAYEKYGFFYGSYLSFKRLFKCTPWNHSSIYDPIPIRRKK
ncbi:MAG: membrane protein insertion efficiency factor YidD [Bacilli bacterium]|nr:membrane protein insertion efficiency factor YidD [Bacilli bacterium]